MINGSHDDLPRETASDLYENAPCGYISFLANGSIFRVNRTLLSQLGYLKEEVPEIKKFQDLFRIGGKIYFETHFFPLIKMQGFVKEINFDILRKDGTSFPALINVDEVKSKSGPPTYRGSILDITDRKKYELALLEAKEKAEKASRAKADFLSTISHEIRTPLNAILGIGNLIQETPLNDLQKEYARILQLSSENLLGLVNNILDLSKLEAQKVKLEQRAFSLKNLLEVLIHTFRIKTTEKKIELKTEFAENLPENLVGDPIKLNQVLTNLLGNAIKFTSTGYVKLKVEVTEKDDKNVVLNFRVIDTGIGIPADKLDLIFQEFSQASYDVNLEYGGTGLGLTISQKLLHMYGSELTVESQEGKGTEFGFRLKFKYTPAPAIIQTKKPEITEALRDSRARILIVDDNPVNIYITRQYLQNWHLACEAAESGSEAVEAVQREQFDLILMDLHMPKMNGYEAAKLIRDLRLDPRPVIIALSASGRGDIDIKMKRAGIDDYVPKPFAPKELQEMLLHYLSGSETGYTQEYPADFSNVSYTEEFLDATSAKESQPSFELSRFLEIAGENKEVFQKLIQNSTRAFTRYKNEFSSAVKENDPETLSELIHKNATSIHYIQANRLSSLIDKCLKIMRDPAVDPETLPELTTVVLKEFEEIIRGLKNVKGKK